MIVLCKTVKIWRPLSGLPEIHLCVCKSCFLEFETMPDSAYVGVLLSQWKRKKHKSTLVFPEVPVPVLFLQHPSTLHRCFCHIKDNPVILAFSL